MKRFAKWVLALALLMGPALAVKADMDKDQKAMPAPKLAPEFDKVKALVGTWKGTAEMNGKSVEVKHSFELTAGGTAVLEKIMCGTDHEMVSVYCCENGKLCMTHYCTAGNQPKMGLTQSSDNSLVFVLKGTSGIHSAKDMHMHAMTLTFKDKDHITEDWSMYVKGKALGAKPFTLARVK